MDRETVIADLKQARCASDDATRHITHMVQALERGGDIPRTARAWAAEKLNRASEIVRRSYDG